MTPLERSVMGEGEGDADLSWKLGLEPVQTSGEVSEESFVVSGRSEK